MPDRATHRFITKLFLGDEYNYVHLMKDLFAPILGKQHRKLGHDTLSNVLIALTTKDPLGSFLAGELHDLVDNIIPYDYNVLFKKGKKVRERKEEDELKWLQKLHL